MIYSCSQIDVTGNRKAVVIHVPYRLRKAFRKIHLRLVRELEKKFSGKVISTLIVLKCDNSLIEKVIVSTDGTLTCTRDKNALALYIVNSLHFPTKHR